MNIPHFLKELRGSLPIPALQKFNKTVEESSEPQEIIRDLLESSPRCFEILSLLRYDKHTYNEIATIFTSLSHILFNIAGELSECKSSGMHITQEVIYDHASLIYQLVTPNSLNKNSRSVLQCLTGMIMVGSDSANDVLINLDWKSMNLPQLLTRREAGVPRDVRAWCIYMLLAFLYSPNNVMLIKQFIQKKELLPSVFPGLKWDSYETVMNVLKVLKETIVFNPDITKTERVRFFTPDNTYPLLHLYRWIGPTGRAHKSSLGIAQEEEVDEKTLQEQEEIKIKVHQLLLSLCTSYEKGLYFRSKIVREGDIWSNNFAIFKIICNLESPWQLDKGRELIKKTLAQIPGIIKPYFFSIREALNPRAESNFIEAIQMVIEILEYQFPWKSLEDKGMKGVQVSLLPSALNDSFFRSVLWSDNERIRHTGILLIITVLSKTKQTLHHMKEEMSLPHESYVTMERNLLLNIHSFLCGFEGIFSCWQMSAHQTLQKNEGTDATNIEVLISIIKVLILCRELYPTIINEDAVNSIDMLHVVRQVTEDEKSPVDKKSAEKKLQLKILCVEFFACYYNRSDIIPNNLAIEETEGQLLEMSILYQLIVIYSQGKENFADCYEDGREKSRSFSTKSLDILSNILVHNGLTEHDEGNLSFWLNHIKGKSAQLPSFLTHVIQKTVSSLGEYTDLLVQLASSSQMNGHGTCRISFLQELEKMDVVDNEDIANLSAALPFSRLLLGALELLACNPNPECIQYFSQVMNDYIHSVNDPVLLSNYLLDKKEVLTPELKMYLTYWSTGKVSSKAKKQSFSQTDITDIVKHLFMSRDWSSVEKLLEVENVKELLKEGNAISICQQILAYLEKELKTNDTSEGKIGQRLVYILKCVSTVLEEIGVDDSKAVIATILENSSILRNYQPFSPIEEYSVTCLVQDLITIILSKYPDLGPVTLPYYEKLVKDIKRHLVIEDGNADFLQPVMPYISLEHIQLSYVQVEELFIICLKFSCTDSVALSNLLLEMLKLLLKTTSAKRKPKTTSVSLMLTKFIEWCHQGASASEEKNMSMTFLENLLIQVLTTEDVKDLCSDDLKALLLSDPIYTKLCCHIVKLHPPHGLIFVKKMKKQKRLTLSRATLLASLLDNEDLKKTVIAILNQNIEILKSWALTMDEDMEEYSKLLNFALNNDMFDTEDLVKICGNMYDSTVMKKAPPQEFLCILPAFQKLAENDTEYEGLPLGAHVSLIHICINNIRYLYNKTGNCEELLKSTAQVINDAVPQTDSIALRNSLFVNKLWLAFVKQVLRCSFADKTLGPCLLDTLTLLVEVVHRNETRLQKKENDAITIYQMIVSHSQYLELMFNKDKEWDPLKEKLVALQQVIVECNQGACKEKHVPILLGAYGASMSALDQQILKLLFTYEQNRSMKNIMPVLWGEAAISYFGVQKYDSENARDIKPQQVLALLDGEKIMKTCSKFDVNLSLEPKEVQSVDPDIYDVRFLLPLMNYFAHEDEINEIEYAECGAASLGFALLTSSNEGLWGGGAALLKSLVERMEKSKHYKLRLPWLWLVGVVSCALNEKVKGIPPLIAQFLIRASALLTQPWHPMYFPVMSYLFLKPAIDMNEIPELFRLFNSDNVRDHHIHRSFLLSMLSTGIRCKSDLLICKRKSAITMIMAMLQAPTVDTSLRLQVLEVFESMARVTSGAPYLVADYNLLTVLPLVVLPETCQDENCTDILRGVLGVLNALWMTFMKTAASRGQNKGLKRKRDEMDEKPTKVSKMNSNAIETMTFQEEYPEDGKEQHNYDMDEEQGELVYDEQDISENNEEHDNVETKEQHNAKDGDKDNSGESAEKPTSIKIASPFFVREFFSCLCTLTPVALSCDSPEIIAQFLEMLTKNVRYIGFIRKEMEQKFITPIHTAALIPEVIKKQINKKVNWTGLFDRLKGRLSDEEEVLFLGSEAEDMQQKWTSEPLSVCQTKPLSVQEEENVENERGYEKLKSSALDLLIALGE